MLRFFMFMFSAFITFGICAQELNVRLNINTQRLPSADKELFTSLENSLNQLLNENKWTNLNFNKNERIDCSMTLFVNESASANNFVGEIQVTIQRPVYNSSYVTSLLNFRDSQFEFTYMQGQSLFVNNSTIDNNLVAVISFYANIILGLDSDSFSLNGGKPYFTKALDIANMAQSLSTKGWEPFSGKNNNRYDLAVALTDDASDVFHNMWYAYHRTGLDEMTINPSRSRIRVIEAVSSLQSLYESRPSSPLFLIIGETKIDEIVRICSQATAEEKQTIKKILSNIFPTKNTIINTLK